MEELQEDLLAFRPVAATGDTLDKVPSNMALQAAFFVLAILETLRRGADIVRHGEAQEDRGSATHPPVALRRQFLVDAYRNEVSDDENSHLSIKAALVPSRGQQDSTCLAREPHTFRLCVVHIVGHSPARLRNLLRCSIREQKTALHFYLWC